MSKFRFGHATHPDWRMAAELALAQVHGQALNPGFGREASLGILYASPHYGQDLEPLTQMLREQTGVADWAGAIGPGVLATGVEYGETPALAIMLLDLPESGFRLFAGQDDIPDTFDAGPPAAAPHTALVHADPATPGLQQYLQQLAACTVSGRLFGGLTGSENDGFSHLANEPLAEGLSGVVFGDEIGLRTRVSQGCAPLAGEHMVSESSSNFICALDGRPALDVLLADLEVPADVRSSRDGDEILRALPAERLREGLFVGLAPGRERRGLGFGDYLVRNVVGIDPENRLLAVAANPAPGDRVVFCTRDRRAAHQDLIRVCTELRDEIEEEGLTVKGALYHSCVARGAHLFGSPGAELELIRHNLGEIPLIGFQANGEIAGDRIYGHTGVLTLFI